MSRKAAKRDRVRPFGCERTEGGVWTSLRRVDEGDQPFVAVDLPSAMLCDGTRGRRDQSGRRSAWCCSIPMGLLVG